MFDALMLCHKGVVMWSADQTPTMNVNAVSKRPGFEHPYRWCYKSINEGYVIAVISWSHACVCLDNHRKALQSAYCTAAGRMKQANTGNSIEA